MNKELYVSANPHETRVALVEDDQLAEIFYERENEYTLAGSIYKGRVTRVLPGMQSAFVDIGLERDAFLYVSDFLDLQDDDDEDFEVAVKTNGTADNTGNERRERGGRDRDRDRDNRREDRQESRREHRERRPEPPPQQNESQAPTAVFEGGYSDSDEAEETAEAAIPDSDNGDSAGESEESDDGTRRWRGRRRRRGGRRGRGGERFERTETQQQAADASDGETEPEEQEPVLEDRAAPFQGREERPGREDRPSRDERRGRRDRGDRGDRGEREERSYGPPAGYQPIILPGESLSKYRNRPQQQSTAAAEPVQQETSAEEQQPDVHEHAQHAEHAKDTEREARDIVAAAFDRVSAPEPANTFVDEVKEETHDEEPTEGFAEMRAPRQVAELRHEPVVETYDDAEQEEFEEEEQVEEAEHAEQVSAEQALAQPSETHEHEEASESEEETQPSSEWQREYEHPQHSVPEAAPEGKTLEHETFDGEESVEPSETVKRIAEDDSAEADMELEEETLEAGGGEISGRWIPQVADIEEDFHDHQVEDFEYSNGNGETAEAAEGEFEEGDEEIEGEEEEEGEEAVATEPGQQPRRRFERGGRRGRRGRRGGPPMRNMQSRNTPLISDLLKEGQEILVQIAKEPIGKKGARITSHIALPGRFLVYMPTVNHVGVSRKIGSDEERQRLKRIVTSERENGHGGFIVRTAAANVKEDELRADIRFLKHLWSEIKSRSEKSKSPALIYHDLNLVERVLRDQVTSDFTTIWVDNELEYERVLRFASRFQPSLVRRIKLYTKTTPLFEEFNIQEEINKALKAKVWLKSGGYIVINQTEALVAIDINTGKYVGKTTRLEDTIVKTNVDAIKEIVRQIRLRDLGGIIVIDFIDMDERKNRQKVMAALEEALKSDRAPSKVLQFNDFGLVAITRKRVKQSLERTLGTPCSYCEATGFVKSVPTMCSEIYTEVKKLSRHLEGKDVTIRVNSEVAKSLKENNGKLVQEFEELTGKTVIVKSDPAMHQEHFDIN
ncbi:MAG TPA: Rne/Rng family ribonuclease [Candidatus Koribacter sp.]|jgi:ribonuclease G